MKGVPHYEPCTDCGTPVLTTRTNHTQDLLCDEHRRLRKLVRDRERSHRKIKNKNHHNNLLPENIFTVIHDPDPIGGFPKNAVLPRSEAMFMMAGCNCAFTEGTRLKDYLGNVYVVKTLKNKQEMFLV